MDKYRWLVVVDYMGERANTIFDDEKEAYAFAELLEKRSSFNAYVRRFKEGENPLSCKPTTDGE